MSTIYNLEAVNLYCGDFDPTKSKHLTITEMKLPLLEEIYVDHHPGGSPVAMEFAVGVSKLSSTFTLNGFDPHLLVQFGLGSRVRNIFTAYGVMRDKRSGRAIEAKAVLEGRLGKADQSAFQRGEITSVEYMIGEIFHYELHFDGSEKIYWDPLTSIWRVDGVDQYAVENRILRIPGSGS